MSWRPVQRISNAAVATVTSRSHTLGVSVHLRRALLLLGGLATLMLAPIHLSPSSARTIVTVLLAIVALGLVSTLAGLRRLITRVLDADLVPGAPQLRTFEAVTGLVRRIGLALPALIFFCMWALVYALIWAHSPTACPADPATACEDAFLGAGAHPTFSDFLYFAVNMAFANPVPDIVANSRPAHTAATIEVLSGIALVTFYATAFFGLGAAGPNEREPV